MAVERLLVDAKRVDIDTFPVIPGSIVEFCNNYHEMIMKVEKKNYYFIMTGIKNGDLNDEKFELIEELAMKHPRVIAVTDYAYFHTIRKRISDARVDLLHSCEIDTIVGQVMNRAPVKDKGKVLVYSRGGTETLLKIILPSYIKPREQITITTASKIEEELVKGEYGLVIDLSQTIESPKYPRASEFIPNIHFLEVPKIVVVKDVRITSKQLGMMAKRYLNNEQFAFSEISDSGYAPLERRVLH